MQENETGLEGTGFSDIIRKKLQALKNWMLPDPADAWYLTLLKSVYKFIALLLLVAFSPVIALVLIITFFAAL